MPKEALPVVCEPIEAKRAPQNAYEAQFSIPYMVAASCVRGRFGLAELENDALNDPKIRSLAQKVGYQIDPNSPYPDYFSGEVIVKTVDGRELRNREAKNRGAGDRPLSSQDIVTKYQDNARLVASPERVERVQAAVLGLETFDDARKWGDVLAG
jgi:2-methylcitrate dehydratase PrpD